ncbi:peptidoglycan-associated lipoprotein [Edaphobacter lichenicola]|jgi:peptidoglycan-associated lipoprotein|uniref:Peptidoglycan-associated protein n=2 Tax=Tunturiibacter gelidiferens TaxID=3069689 RepID=A0A9X0U5Y8_9BACT|nr:OmpA family protein [Edaphobacter lichenicola]MBB5329242.1 peptidoglycan-associated lipoprotein [Edaphobacter lichenicola]
MNAMHAGIRKTLVIAATLISIGAVTGCHKKASGIDPNALGPAPALPAAAPTATITADPLAIDLGQSVILNWRTQNATSVTIDGIGDVNTNGTQTVAPSTSTNFHLTAKGDGGTTEASVRVTVRVPVAPTAPPPADNDMGTDAAFHENVQDVFFDYDSYDLRPDATAAASKAAAYLTAHPAIRVVIGGYCDDRGSAEYNLALGENRANAARTALVSAGVQASRLRVISYGKEKQFCTEDNESCWQQNRRAQFSLDR